MAKEILRFMDDLFPIYSYQYPVFTMKVVNVDQNNVAQQLTTKTTDEGSVTEIDVPGHNSSDVDVTVNDRTLTIKSLHGTRKFSDKIFKIKKDYDSKSVKANVKDGVLTITLKKAPVETQTFNVKVT